MSNNGQGYQTQAEIVVLSDRRAWLAERQTGIGASEAASILGESPYKSTFRLWSDKVGLTQPEPAEGEAIEWGHLLEDPIAQRYSRETEHQIVNPGATTIHRHPVYPFIFATLDRVISGDERGPGVLECKNVDFFLADEWQDEAPTFYQIQLQHQLMVTGFTWGVIAGLIGGNRFRYMVMDRDEGFITMLRQAEVEFWSLVQNNVPPAVDGSESTRAALSKLYPLDNGMSIALPVDAIDWHDELVQAKAEIAKWTDVRNLQENRLKAAIGEATIGVLPNGITYRHGRQRRAAYTCPETEFRVLRCQMPSTSKPKRQRKLQR